VVRAPRLAALATAAAAPPAAAAAPPAAAPTSHDAAPDAEAARAASTSAPAPSARPRRAVRLVGPVDVNVASSDDLQRLKGIGPALAGRILAHRAAHGPFRTVDDLQRVRGIGPKTVAKLRPHVTVGDG
jgi:competence protein ComEA